MKKKLKILLSFLLVLSFLFGYGSTFVYATNTDTDAIEEDEIDSKTAPVGDFKTGDDIPKDLFTTYQYLEDDDGNIISDTDWYTEDILKAIDATLEDDYVGEELDEDAKKIQENMDKILLTSAGLSPNYIILLKFNSKYYGIEVNETTGDVTVVEDTDDNAIKDKVSSFIPRKILQDNKDKLGEFDVYIYNAETKKGMYTFKFSDIGKYISQEIKSDADLEKIGIEPEDYTPDYTHTLSITGCEIQKDAEGKAVGAILTGTTTKEITDIDAIIEETLTSSFDGIATGFLGVDPNVEDKSKNFYIDVTTENDCKLLISSADEDGGEGYLEYELKGLGAINKQLLLTDETKSQLDAYDDMQKTVKEAQESSKADTFTLSLSDIPDADSVEQGKTITITLSSDKAVYLSGAGYASDGNAKTLKMEIDSNGTYNYQGVSDNGTTQSGVFTVNCFKRAKSRYQEPSEDPWSGVSGEEYLVQTGIFNSNRPLMLLSIWGMIMAVCGIVLLVIKKVREVK